MSGQAEVQESGGPDPAKRKMRCGRWEDRPDGSSIYQKCGRVDFDLDDFFDDEMPEPIKPEPMVPLADAEKLATALESFYVEQRTDSAAWFLEAKWVLEAWRAAHPREETTDGA